jgi:hypothetical protein
MKAAGLSRIAEIIRHYFRGIAFIACKRKVVTTKGMFEILFKMIESFHNPINTLKLF